MKRVNERQNAITALEQKLGYQFKDKALLDRALTHASVAEGAKKIADNERLEFLGDRVLGLMVAQWLVETFNEATEGELSKRLHSLVSRDFCAQVARQLGIGEALRLAAGETKSGGRDNPSILGDATEALIAAVYTENGYQATQALFQPFWASAINSQDHAFATNPKSFLQEWAAQQKMPPPIYKILGRKGPDHAPVFAIELILDGHSPLITQGRSIQDAEKKAALSFIQREGLS